MRLPVALLSVVAVPASVLAAPVVTPPAGPAGAVAPEVHELDLPVADEAATTDGTRTLVSTPQQRTEPFSDRRCDLAAGRRHRRAARAGPHPVAGGVDAVDTRWRPRAPRVLEDAPEERRRGVRAGTEPLYAGPSDGVQVRVEVLSGEAPRDLRLALVDPGDLAGRRRRHRRPWPAAPPRRAGPAGHPQSRPVGRRRVDPDRVAQLRLDAERRHAAPHGQQQRLHGGRGARRCCAGSTPTTSRARAGRTSATTSWSTSSARLGGAGRRPRQSGDRRARRRLQHRHAGVSMIGTYETSSRPRR
jgi:hypothetical protein